MSEKTTVIALYFLVKGNNVKVIIYLFILCQDVLQPIYESDEEELTCYIGIREMSLLEKLIKL